MARLLSTSSDILRAKRVCHSISIEDTMGVYQELFEEDQSVQLDTGEADGESLIRAICAVADEIRGLKEAVLALRGGLPGQK